MMPLSPQQTQTQQQGPALGKELKRMKEMIRDAHRIKRGRGKDICGGISWKVRNRVECGL